MRSTRKKLLFPKVKFFLSSCWEKGFNAAIIDTCGSLLIGGKETVSYDLYDLLMAATVYSEDKSTENIQKYLHIVSSYTKKYSEYEHLINLQNILLNNDRLNSLSSTALISINLLINDFYSETNVACVTSKDNIVHSSMHPKYKISIYDLIIIICAINNVSTTQSRIFSASAYKKILKLYEEQFGSLFIKEIKQYIGENAKTLLNHMINSGTVINTTNTFMTNTLIRNNIFQTLGWAREYVSKDENSMANFLFTIISNLPKNIIMHRKFYIRDKGVTVKFTNPMDDITYISMREIHKEAEGLHYIEAHAVMNKAIRSIYIPIENISGATFPLLYEKDYMLVFHILHVLGIIPILLEKVKSKEFNPKGFDRDTKESYTEVIERIANEFKDLKYTFEEPYWWNYDTKSAGSPSKENGGARIEKKINIGKFVRALPPGHTASEEAKSLANKYRIILEPGHTLVDDFEKSVYIKI